MDELVSGEKRYLASATSASFGIPIDPKFELDIGSNKYFLFVEVKGP